MLSSHFLGFVALHVASVCSSPLQHNWNSTYRTAYFQDNDPAGSSVIALKISNVDGTLSNPVRTSTGGKGITGALGVSQDSVVVSENYLFVANPGDDTLSLFAIDPTNPEHPSLIGKPAPTLGETPISVAYSPLLDTACVLNSGAIAGVTCYSVDSEKGLTALGGLRPIPQTENQDPSPPIPGPLTIGQDISFNPSSTALFITIRSNGKNPGLIYAFPVEKNNNNNNQTHPHPQVSTNSTLSSLSTLPLVFSLNFLHNNDADLIVTSPHLSNPGAAFLHVSYPSLSVTLAQTLTIPNQIASCWVAPAPHYDSLFVIDAGVPNITVLDSTTGDLKGVAPFGAPVANASGAGGLDSEVAGEFLYVLTLNQTDPRVDVLKIGGVGLLTLVQSFDVFGEVGRIAGWMGMAIWPVPS